MALFGYRGVVQTSLPHHTAALQRRSKVRVRSSLSDT
jgi:hypothetical protein